MKLGIHLAGKRESGHRCSAGGFMAGLWLIFLLAISAAILPGKTAAGGENEGLKAQPPSGSEVKGDASLDRSKDCHPRLLALLRQKNLYLQKRDQDIRKEEQDLDFLKREMESKVKILKDLQRSLEGPVKKKKYQEQAKLQHLAGVYGAMEPARAAALLDKMDEDTVTKLFAIMKSKKVAPILARMSPDKAARISACLYRKPPDL